MAETFKSIPYGNDHIEVTELEFEAWEDAICSVPHSNDWYEWTTYDFLLSQGYFCSKPKVPRPVAEAEEVTAGGSAAAGKKQKGAAEPAAAEIGERYAWEPSWSQSKILAEKDKLLKEREKDLARREKGLDLQMKQANAQTAVDRRERERLDEENDRLRAELEEVRDLLEEARRSRRTPQPADRPRSLAEMSAAEYVANLRSSAKRIALVGAILVGVFMCGVWNGLLANPKGYEQKQATVAEQRK